MRILCNNQSFAHFGSRNKEIRKADDIQRKVNNNFDFISSSRIDDFYDSSNNYEHKIKAKEVSEKLRNVILTARYAADVLRQTGNGIGVLLQMI